MARLRLVVHLAPWVIPYLQMWAALGGGARCSNAVREYVLANGVRTSVPRQGSSGAPSA